MSIFHYFMSMFPSIISGKLLQTITFVGIKKIEKVWAFITIMIYDHDGSECELYKKNIHKTVQKLVASLYKVTSTFE